jgi:hypothetical protein
MKEILKNIGISEKTIDSMIEICPNIQQLNSEEIIEKINILKHEKCNDTQIRDIIGSNPAYLDASETDVKKLIDKLRKLGFKNLNFLFDENPYILNSSDFEIEEYINERVRNGELLENIVDDMNENAYLFDEI